MSIFSQAFAKGRRSEFRPAAFLLCNTFIYSEGCVRILLISMVMSKMLWAPL